LSSEFKKDLALADDYIYTAKFKQAGKLIEKILKSKELSEKQRLATLGLQTELLAFLGDYKTMINIADGILVATENKKSHTRIKALIIKAYVYCQIGNFSECKHYIQESEQLLADAENIPNYDYNKYKMFLLYTQTSLYNFTADVPNVKKYTDQLIELAKKCKSEFFHISGLFFLVSYYNLIDDVDKRNEILNETMAPIVEQTENDNIKINYKFHLTIIYLPKSSEEMKKKIATLEELIIAAETLGTKGMLGAFYFNTAGVYSSILETDKALEYYHKSFNLYKISFAKNIYLHNVAWQYVVKREFETAKSYFLQSLEHSKEIESQFWQAKVITNIIPVLIELDEIDQAHDYLTELKLITETLNQENITNSTKLAEARILTASKKIKDWVKAQEIFEELLTKELDDTQKVTIYFNDSELLMKELQMTGDEETLYKLKENITAMVVISNNRVYTQFYINLLRLQSKLALLEYQEEKAKELLLEAKTRAEQYNLPKFIAEIEAERKILEEQVKLWQTSKKKEEPLKERLEHIGISKSMKDMKEKTVIEERNKETGQFIGQQKLFAIKF